MSAVNETATPRYEIVSLLRLALHSWHRPEDNVALLEHHLRRSRLSPPVIVS